MPSNLLDADSRFPSLRPEKSTDERFDEVKNYLFLLLEQLRYSLRNLDASNFNETGLKEITDPIYIRLEGELGELVEIAITKSGIMARMTNAEGEISELQQTADGITVPAQDFRLVGSGRAEQTGRRYLHFGPSSKSVKRVCREVHELTHSRNVLLPVETVVKRVNRLLKGWGAFYSVGYPSRVFRKVNHYVLKRMARFLNRKSQRYYRLKFADTYYGEMTHYGLYRLAWADVRRARD